MKIIEITSMYALQQYYCDTCWGDWFALFLIIGFVLVAFIVGGTESSRQRKENERLAEERRERLKLAEEKRQIAKNILNIPFRFVNSIL